METEIKLTTADINDILKESVANIIRNKITQHKADIESGVDAIFKKSVFDSKTTNFEKALDLAMENEFRIGIEMALKELDFKKLVAIKAIEILSDGNFIKEVAEKKVLSSLGL